MQPIKTNGGTDDNRAEGALRAALNDMELARDVFGGPKRAAEGLVNQ